MMNRKAGMICGTAIRHLLPFCWALSGVAASTAEVPSIEERIEIRQWLLLPKVGESDRAPFPIDPITHRLVTGTWRPPTAGDEVPGGGDKPAVWIAVESQEGERLEHEYLKGGWAYARIAVDAPCRAILRAAGNSIAYINGEPRVGNIYRYGYVMVPILLKKEDNHLLFRCARYGTLQASIEPVTDKVMVNMGDATLPDRVRGETQPLHAGLVVLNTTTKPLDVAQAQGERARAGADAVVLPHYWMPPLSIAKLPVELPPGKPVRGEEDTRVYHLTGKSVQTTRIEIDVVEPDEFRKVTFVSGIEGSVQYYAFRPRRRPLAPGRSALMLHTHGAGDEVATAYRDKYYAKTWCSIASATNRRPYGFDWEDWGRIDALEVLDHATALVDADPSRIYLGGHSMGGHGVWQLAGHFPDRFAAIGPGAGWQDFWTYSSAVSYENPNSIQQLLDRCANPSRTPLLVPNYAQHGVFILHGDADDIVPIEEAYSMRARLEQAGHRDHVLYVEPGGGHVWDSSDEPGWDCFDLLDLFEFFQRHSRPVAPQRVDFTTISPAISSSCWWVRVEQQIEQLQPSRVRLQLDPGQRRLFGSLENVQRFGVDPSLLIVEGPLTVQFDDAAEEKVEWPGGMLHFVRRKDGWQPAPPLPRAQKGPHRSGPFKQAFLHRPILVVGTAGSEEENAWALRKARFDNETFWYRGNASFQIVLDAEFDPSAETDRNVVLYGNAHTNLAWKALLGDSPVRVARGEVSVGDTRFTGDDLSCLLIRPRPGSDIACVGVVGGTGLEGLRATNALRYFVAGVYYPDFTVFRAGVWQLGDAGVLATGFFGNDWSLAAGDVAWAE